MRLRSHRFLVRRYVDIIYSLLKLFNSLSKIGEDLMEFIIKQ